MIKIRKGLNLPISGAPKQNVAQGNTAAKVALVGDDYVGLRPTLEVQVGDRVKLGQLLFTDKNNPINFNSDADIEGKTLCRPAGYFTFDFDQNGRRWLLDQKITLKQPRTVKDCFDMVMNGEADAVAMNEFTGRATIKEHDLADRIAIEAQPLSVVGLHVVVHKTHPEAADMLAMINDGLRGAREKGTYQNIIEDHMARIWAEF